MQIRSTRHCGRCGAALEADAAFCPACGNRADNTNVNRDTSGGIKWSGGWDESPKQKERKSWVKKPSVSGWKRIAIPVTAIVLILALALSALGRYFAVLGGPLQRLQTALYHTLRSGSFAMDIKGYDDTNYCYFDLSSYFQYDIKNDDLRAWITRSDSDDYWEAGILDGDIMTSRNGKVIDTENIQKEIENYFEFARQIKKGSIKDLDWNLIFPGLEYTYARVIDMDQAAEDAAALQKCLNDKDWMEKNAKYSCKRKNGTTTYSMQWGGKFLAACLKCFKDSFYQREDYRELLAEFNDCDADDTVTLRWSIKNGKLTGFSVMAFGDVGEFTLRGIGNTVVGEQELREFFGEN